MFLLLDRRDGADLAFLRATCAEGAGDVDLRAIALVAAAVNRHRQIVPHGKVQARAAKVRQRAGATVDSDVLAAACG